MSPLVKLHILDCDLHLTTNPRSLEVKDYFTRARSGREMKIAIEDVKFDEQGLIPAVVQDARSRQVLLLCLHE